MSTTSSARLANENSRLSEAYNEFLFLDKCETFFQLTLQEKLESAVLPSGFSSLQRPSRQIFLYTPDIDEIDKMLSIALHVVNKKVFE